MTESARALVLEAPRTLVETEIDLPTTGADDGLLRVDACGLCGTDHEQYTGQLHPGVPFVPGHEIVGTVEALGERASDRWGVSAGDRVAVEVFLSCAACVECESGTYRRCVRHGIADMIGFVPTPGAPRLWGGYATHLYLPPDVLLLPVPDGLDPVLATVFNPLGAGLRWAAELPATGEGDTVAVLGPGIRGLCSLVAAKEAGASFVAVTGAGEADHARLEIARDFGADLVVDVLDEDPVRAIRRATDGGVDVTIDVTANAPTALGQAVGMTRSGGTIVLAGTRNTDETPGFHPDHVVYKELRIVGALGVQADDYRRALDILAAGRYPFADLPRRTAGLDGADELVRTMAGELGPDRPLHGVLAP